MAERYTTEEAARHVKAVKSLGYGCGCLECKEAAEHERTPSEPARATFEAAMHRVLGGALALAEQRGAEYADSWNEQNLSTKFVRSALRTIDPNERVPLDFNDIRILIAAALCDVKISRMTGPYKDDTCDDLINYVAFFRDLMHQYTTDG